MYKRIQEKKIKKLLQHFPVVAIVGPRQVGKTTLAKEITKQIEKEVVYLDLENPRDIAKLQDAVLYFEANEKKCIILDEIQRKPELFPILRSIIDANSYIMGYSKGAFGRMMSPNAQACVDSQAWLAFLKLTFEISCSGCNGSLVIGSN